MMTLRCRVEPPVDRLAIAVQRDVPCQSPSGERTVDGGAILQLSGSEKVEHLWK